MSEPNRNASEAVGASQSKARWWASAGVRLPAPIACLALAVSALLNSAGPLGSSATSGSQHQPKPWWPASYVMRVWSADPEVKRRYDDVVADVFELADPRHARSFPEEAASARCR